MEDQREKESNLTLRKSFTIIGVLLVLLGFYVLATITSLVRAYIAKPDAQNGGIVILSRFVHISYTASIGIVGATGFLVLVGIFILFVGTRKPTPVSTALRPWPFDRLTSIVYGPLNSCMIEARSND
ncbi:MAG TPA: hypothetical protein VF910_02955 [Candidatus Bathyarchaeia archaeon]